MSSKKDPKKVRKEIEEIKMLKDLDMLLKKNTMENAFLSNPSKDSETINSNVADNILSELDKETISPKELETIERLTSVNSSSKVQKSVRAVKGKTGIKITKKTLPKKTLIKKKKPVPKKSARPKTRQSMKKHKGK
ncbi:MAG: hypothetical protein LVQ97_05450 [Candidatus Micrarchaeales archaeon]|jgi:hypothetical protein|uniref:Uncharacterized protein n=1 Tax=Candidatus Micrarchaeum acidiphilum ARMAN-2 TaxID=425595 RepID=C7DIP9_MICA2|nr:MAG: hypothetical protein UNLARM2_0937 [Candidatus Micrarchaeum acidiphilum ARMAN-2]MCW6161601.1 hypothetical protein [Candidatus Micrarchaeales archaeon]